MNSKRLGEGIIKDNVLHHELGPLSVDATTAEENAKLTLPKEGAKCGVLKLDPAVYPSRLSMT